MGTGVSERRLIPPLASGGINPVAISRQMGHTLPMVRSMNKSSSFVAKILTVTVLLAGSFVFQAPASAHTASVSHASITTNDASVQQSAPCVKQACVSTHNTCEKHCWSEPQEPTATIASTVSYGNLLPPAPPRMVFLRNPFWAGPYFAPPDRTAPTRAFLRSVIKRE